MRQNIFWILLLLSSIGLAGCAAGEGVQAEPTKARLSLETWPTPAPTATPITPTPFPKVTVEATATSVPPTPKPANTPEADSAGRGPDSSDLDITLGGVNISEIVLQQANRLISERFPPIGVGFTTVDNAALLAGPGYGQSQTLARGELLGIIGRNSDGSYLYGFGTELKRGWVAADQLRVTGDLGKAPLLPADPVRAIIEEFAASGGLTGTGSDAAESSSGGKTAGEGESSGAENSGAAPASTLTAADLPAISTGTVTLEGLNVRQGPGTIYGGLGVLAEAETVQVLATNRFQDWVLVAAGDPAFGWVSLDYLTVAGNIDELPVIRSVLPESGIPAGEVAAILSINAEPVADRGEPVPAASSGLTSSGAVGPGLGAVATAGLNAPEVELRRGPGSDFGTLDTLTADDTIVSILGRDDGATWVLVQVQNFTQDLGWVAVSDLTIDGSVQDAPPVITAWVESNGLALRRGPGIIEETLGQINLGNLVAVLGLNEGRSWALVQPVAGGGPGWVQLQFLEVGAPLASLPRAPDLPVGPGAAPTAEVLAPPPIAPRPVSQSQLVIQRSSGGEIVVINPDGSGLRSLTRGIDPDLSPDGQTVAFTRWDGAEQGSLLTIGIDGNNERVVLAESKQAKGAAWSPDGTQIMVNFQQGGRVEAKDICTDLTQDNPRTPPRNADNFSVGLDENLEPELCWTIPPDPFWNLRLVDLADSSFVDVDGGTYAFRPAFDPAQPWRVVSDGGRGLLAVDVNNPDFRQLLSESPADGSPVFSPDGRYIALSAGPQAGGVGHDIFRVNRDGSGRIRLTDTPLWVTAQPDSDTGGWNNVAPAWAPDGSQIAFLTDRTGRWEVWLMNADGSNPQPMFSEAISDRLDLEYNFVDERVITWR